MVQEALTNVLRHAHATRALVSFERRDGDLVVTVRDDGRGGGATGGTGQDGGMGISGMRSRVEALGGTLEAGPGPQRVPGAGGHPGGLVIRVALVDDQPLVRMGLATLIAAEDDLELVGEAGDGREALGVLRRTTPDVVLCDIRMPVMDGLEMLQEVAADPGLADVKVVMLTTFELDEYVFEALRHGASGFLLKDAEPESLLDAVRVVAEGGSLLAPSVTTTVIQHFGGSGPPTRPHPRLGDLTEREREIVAWVATGRSNQEIAEELVVSPDTVRTHVSRAMVKLQARDRAQLVVFAIESGVSL